MLTWEEDLPSGPEDLLHGLAMGKLVHHLVEDADVAHEGVFDLRDPDAANLARELEAICVLKDSVTAVSDGKECYLNQTGNAGMAKAGSGDVLAGIIGALLAQGLPQFDAARLGVYLHGRAGDKAVEDRSEHSLLAREIAENINS